MRRALPIFAVLGGLLVLAPSALAVKGHGGYNGPTNKLERAFKVALFYRAADKRGCYLPAPRMAKAITKKIHLRTAVGGGDNSVHRPNLVYVLRHGTSCNHLRMAIRAPQGLFVLDTDIGPVFLKGHGGPSQELISAGRGPLRDLTTATKSFSVRTPNLPQRLDLLCPRGTFPLGGGEFATPVVSPDGEGIYPHSYERLGVQHGWHVSVVLFDPAKPATPRQVTLQVVCGRGLVATSAPHKTVFIRTGQTKTAVARCPSGTRLFSGGFQRNNWVETGGSYVTESRAAGNAWQVSGHAFARWGGELTAIAYCAKDSPGITEVSASSALLGGLAGTATTPPCPAGQSMIAGGFSSNGSTNSFFSQGYITRDGTWTATGFAFFGPTESFTAYGYCIQPG